MVHDRRIDGEAQIFGNQGALFMRAMTWWDHKTESIWSQPWGMAIDGPLEGTRLKLIPARQPTGLGDLGVESAEVSINEPGPARRCQRSRLHLAVDVQFADAGPNDFQGPGMTGLTSPHALFEQLDFVRLLLPS